jgi:hypothetical protein
MNDTELQELDGWIAEHVLGWKWFRYLKERSELYSERRTLMDKPNRYVRKAKGGEPLAEDAFDNIPKSTTDPAAAMQVLRRCADKTPVVQISYFGGLCGYVVSARSTDGPIKAPTIELAICLFAKKLFS